MILFVVTNPQNPPRDSAMNLGEMADECVKTFNLWKEYLVPTGNYDVINISHKSSLTLVSDVPITKYVAMGDEASGALNVFGVDHFKIPDCSPFNPFLKNTVQVEAVLEECKKYLNS